MLIPLVVLVRTKTKRRTCAEAVIYGSRVSSDMRKLIERRQIVDDVRGSLVHDNLRLISISKHAALNVHWMFMGKKGEFPVTFYDSVTQ